MQKRIIVLLSLAIGAGCGAAAVEALRAQTRPPAYAVAEFEVTDAAVFKDFAEGNTKGVTAAGGKFVVRRGKTLSLAGEPPKTIALVAWDNFDQARACYASETWKSLAGPRDKGAKFRAFLVETTP